MAEKYIRTYNAHAVVKIGNLEKVKCWLKAFWLARIHDYVIVDNDMIFEITN